MRGRRSRQGGRVPCGGSRPAARSEMTLSMSPWDLLQPMTCHSSRRPGASGSLDLASITHGCRNKTRPIAAAARRAPRIIGSMPKNSSGMAGLRRARRLPPALLPGRRRRRSRCRARIRRRPRRSVASRSTQTCVSTTGGAPATQHHPAPRSFSFPCEETCCPEIHDPSVVVSYGRARLRAAPRLR